MLSAGVWASAEYLLRRRKSIPLESSGLDVQAMVAAGLEGAAVPSGSHVQAATVTQKA
jgi:hypothetical protein